MNQILSGIDYSETFFTSLQCSPDNFSQREDNDGVDQPQTLIPAHRLPLRGSQAYTPHPGFDISNPNSTLVLTSQAHTPIQLRNALSPASQSLSVSPSTHTFKLFNPETDDLITPSSLLFTSPTTFIAGATNALATFDLERPGGPVHVVKTAPGRKYRTRHVFPGPLGRIETVALAPESRDGLLAAGTWRGEVGLFPNAGGVSATTAFSVRADAESYGIGGRGVTQVAWSPCGRYLYVCERNSDGILVYDVRSLRKCVGACVGRAAKTSQKLGLTVVESAMGHAVLAGGMDGCVRYWEGPAMTEGRIEADESLRLHEDAVSSVSMDPWGEVMMTCFGSRIGATVSIGDESKNHVSGSGSSSSSSSTEQSSLSFSIASSTSSSIAASKANVLGGNLTWKDFGVRVWAIHS